jgi:hypothetical protein
MRTTIRMDEHLLREAKAYAAATDRTLARLIEDALREAPARRDAQPAPRRVRLTTVGGPGPRPGVDLDRDAKLLDIMERLE